MSFYFSLFCLFFYFLRHSSLPQNTCWTAESIEITFWVTHCKLKSSTVMLTSIISVIVYIGVCSYTIIFPNNYFPLCVLGRCPILLSPLWLWKQLFFVWYEGQNRKKLTWSWRHLVQHKRKIQTIQTLLMQTVTEKQWASLSISRDLIRKAPSRAPPQTHWLTIYTLSSILGDFCTHCLWGTLGTLTEPESEPSFSGLS